MRSNKVFVLVTKADTTTVPTSRLHKSAEQPWEQPLKTDLEPLNANTFVHAIFPLTTSLIYHF